MPGLLAPASPIDFYVNKETAFLRYVNYLSNPCILWRNFLGELFTEGLSWEALFFGDCGVLLN